MKYALSHSCEQTSSYAEVARLKLFLPQSISSDSREVQAQALAFAEWYKNDVFQLEHEWDILSSALHQAWQASAYEAVERFVDALAYPMMRLCSFVEAERFLRMGIEASRHLQNRKHCALFQSRLGCLLFAQGEYWQGRQLWYEGLEALEPSSGAIGVWEPLYSFAYIVDMLGSYTEAQWFAEYITHFSHLTIIQATECMAVALFVKGFYARLSNQAEQAISDLKASLQYLAQLSADDATVRFSLRHQLFMLIVQTELARAQGGYLRAQAYAESAFALGQSIHDRYTLAALLLDQGLFSCTYERYTDTATVVSRLHLLLPYLTTPHIYYCRNMLEGTIAKSLPQQCEPRLPESQVPLSTREIEVLQLVAGGLSNREIAQTLVVTQSTVKKHLEHIYGKLDVCSRTSALAKARSLNMLT